MMYRTHHSPGRFKDKNLERKILVIGSNSFSGSDFIDLLLSDANNRVVGISRSLENEALFLPYKRRKSLKFSFQQVDLNKDISMLKNLLENFKPEYIVNFAAQSEVAPSWKSPWDWFQTNTVSLARLLDYLKDAKYLKRYVHISSPEVYGSCQGIVREDAVFNPTTPYAASKAAADLLLSTYVKNFDFPLSTVRATNVYGAHQQLFKIVPRTIINIKSGKVQELHGGGKAVKSYIHIRDISHGELLVMEKGKTGELYHFSPDAGIVVREVVKKICERMVVDFKSATKDVAERLGQDNAYMIDSSKARLELDWQPQISIEQGLDEVIAWIEKNWAKIKTLPLEYIHKP